MKLSPQLALLVILFACSLIARADDAVTLEFNHPQTAVLDPANWDKTFADEKYFDALRAMLVRFPGSADAIYAKLKEGFQVDKAELVLRWKDQEGAHPERGRSGWGAEDLYKGNPGEWHVIAYPLRKPWSTADPALGPTFNASINGLAFWEHGGARGDGTDRGERFGPLPLFKPAKMLKSTAVLDPEAAKGDTEVADAPSLTARLDVTNTLTDPRYGETVGQRLRALEDCGFQVHKFEIRDMKYRSFWAYDWSVGIGYMKIWVYNPKLVVTFHAAPGAVPGTLPPATDFAALAARVKASGGSGTPSVRYPPNEPQLAAQDRRQPPGVPDWSWQRIQELHGLCTDPRDVALFLGRGYNYATLFANDPTAYMASMKALLQMPPRHWQGHQTTDFAILVNAYPDLLPPAVQDHLRLYWEAWLHPNVANRQDVGGGQQRGGPTYFRGYSDGGGTMNFGHNAVMGALLAGQYLHAPYVLADARRGLDHLARYWEFFGGANQEIGDTYYLAISVGAAGAIAKYAEDPVDKLQGRIIRDRLVEPMISMYNTGLRRTTHPQARGNTAYQMLIQEGPYHILHTLSPDGVLMHLDDLKKDHHGTPATWGSIHGLSILGDEGAPERISVLSPWTEPYLTDALAYVIDRKPLPWAVMARDMSPAVRYGWHVNYLSKDYSLASRDNCGQDYGICSVVAQWRRTPARVARMEDLSTLAMSSGFNGDYLPTMGGCTLLQHNNKLIAMKELPFPRQIPKFKAPVSLDTAPEAGNDKSAETADEATLRREAAKPGARAMHASVVVMACGDVSKREVWINDTRADAVSGMHPEPPGNWEDRMTSARPNIPHVFAHDGDIITINDGVTYLGLIPVTANALERDQQVEITYEQPLLLIHVYGYRSAKVLDLAQLYASKTPPQAGFVMEFGDASEYPDFAAFRRHMQAAKLTTQLESSGATLNITYASGNDVLEMGSRAVGEPKYRRANGQSPFLPEGIDRESPWSIQGTSGQLEIAGALLTTTPGQKAYLLAIPTADTYIAYNPLPDPNAFSLHVPATGAAQAAGITVKANGKVSLLRLTMRPKENHLWIDYAAKPDQTGPEMATALLVSGTNLPPQVTINDQAAPQPQIVTTDGQVAYVVPLVVKK